MVRLYSILLLSLGLATSCGPKEPERRDLYPASTQTTKLVTGSSFLNAPDNWINFSGLSRNGKLVKYLLFTAPFDGKLVLSKSSYGLGESCQGSQGGKDFAINYTYRIKDTKTNSFSMEVVPDDLTSNKLLSEISLKAGQELQISLELDSYADCRSATIGITAVF